MRLLDAQQLSPQAAKSHCEPSKTVRRECIIGKCERRRLWRRPLRRRSRRRRLGRRSITGTNVLRALLSNGLTM